jgi:hypothetical protein
MYRAMKLNNIRSGGQINGRAFTASHNNILMFTKKYSTFLNPVKSPGHHSVVQKSNFRKMQYTTVIHKETENFPLFVKVHFVGGVGLFVAMSIYLFFDEDATFFDFALGCCGSVAWPGLVTGWIGYSIVTAAHDRYHRKVYDKPDDDY